MKIFTLSFLCSFFICANLFAQKDQTYAQHAADIQKKIWEDKSPEFDVKTIPAGMEKESAVIIAQLTNIEQTSTGRLKFAFYIPSTATRTHRVTTFRERVKINDKAALDNFSTLEYQKSLDKTTRFFNFRLLDKKDIYIGVKILKPNGSEVIVNTGEEVLTKNETKDQQGKLAIPGLEVGDILDYYVSKVELVEEETGSTGVIKRLFLLANEYPILNYQVSLLFNKKLIVSYINANNAPPFVETKDTNGDRIFNLKLKNLPKYEASLWTSPLRQYPYIELGTSFSDIVFNPISGLREKYDKNESKLVNSVASYESGLANAKFIYPDIKSRMKNHYSSGKEYKNAPLDSTMNLLYESWKYRTFCYYDGKDMDVTNRRNEERAASQINVLQMAHTLVDLNIDFDILMVSPRTNSSLDNVFQNSDMAALIRINGGSKPLYMCFNDIFTHFNEIPQIYQGEDAVMISPKRNRLNNFEISRTKIPVIASKENYMNAQLNVSFLPDNMQKIRIERNISEGGSLRHDDQANLMLMEKIDAFYTDLLNGDPLEKRMSRYENGKKLAIEYKNAFEKAREDELDNFKGEVKNEYNEEPQKFSNYKITGAGLTSASPVFSFTSTFVMDNFVKKAGNNYIFEVGKLMGVYTKIEDKERQRKVDVYMPAARTFSYNINITIPKGYQVKGVEELNQTKKNATGDVNVNAQVNGDILNIKLQRTYNHNYEQVTEWPKLVELMDNAYAFSIKKVLFEKI